MLEDVVSCVKLKDCALCFVVVAPEAFTASVADTSTLATMTPMTNLTLTTGSGNVSYVQGLQGTFSYNCSLHS